jgi:hypothetical protein
MLVCDTYIRTVRATVHAYLADSLDEQTECPQSSDKGGGELSGLGRLIERKTEAKLIVRAHLYVKSILHCSSNKELLGTLYLATFPPNASEN